MVDHGKARNLRILHIVGSVYMCSFIHNISYRHMVYVGYNIYGSFHTAQDMCLDTVVMLLQWKRN